MSDAKGIRIRDKIGRIVSVELPDILEKIPNGEEFYWTILFIDATGDLGEGIFMVDFEEQVNHSEKGLWISWEELNSIAKKFFQIIDVILIGCKDQNFLKRYPTDLEMYETCDIVISMIDSSYWEVFSKEAGFIDKLAKKFKDTEFLAPNFEK